MCILNILYISSSTVLIINLTILGKDVVVISENVRRDIIGELDRFSLFGFGDSDEILEVTKDRPVRITIETLFP